MPMSRFPWLRMHRKTAPEMPLEPPIMLGNKSNGEFFWEQTPRERRMHELSLRLAAERSRKLGMDRREFLASALGMATSLSVVNLVSGCGGDGNGFTLPPGATFECDAATEALSGDEFILDLQTHHIDDEETWRERHPGGTWTGEGFASF